MASPSYVACDSCSMTTSAQTSFIVKSISLTCHMYAFMRSPVYLLAISAECCGVPCMLACSQSRAPHAFISACRLEDPSHRRAVGVNRLWHALYKMRFIMHYVYGVAPVT